MSLIFRAPRGPAADDDGDDDNEEEKEEEEEEEEEAIENNENDPAAAAVALAPLAAAVALAQPAAVGEDDALRGFRTEFRLAANIKLLDRYMARKAVLLSELLRVDRVAYIRLMEPWEDAEASDYASDDGKLCTRRHIYIYINSF